MFRKTLMVIVTAFFIFGISKMSFAMMCGGHDKHQQIAQAETEHKHEATEATAPVIHTEAVNVGNKICPVSNEKIKDGEKYQVEYEGKIYNLCCKMCLKDFKKDPQKYIEKLEEMEEKETQPETQMHKGMHEGHQHTESYQEHQH